jgi:hypothetical protein
MGLLSTVTPNTTTTIKSKSGNGCVTVTDTVDCESGSNGSYGGSALYCVTPDCVVESKLINFWLRKSIDLGVENPLYFSDYLPHRIPYKKLTPR